MVYLLLFQSLLQVLQLRSDLLDSRKRLWGDLNSLGSRAPNSPRSSLSTARPFEGSNLLGWTTTKAPSRVSFKMRRTSSRFKCPPQMLQVITGPTTISLGLRSLPLEDANSLFDIFNLPVGGPQSIYRLAIVLHPDEKLTPKLSEKPPL